MGTAISGVVLAVTEVHLVTRCLATRIRMKGDRDSRRKQRKITRQATAVEETTVMGHGKVVTPAGAAVRVAADGEVAPVATDLVQAVILGVVVVAVTTAMAATKAGMVVAEVEADRCEVAMLVADRSPTPESIQVEAVVVFPEAPAMVRGATRSPLNYQFMFPQIDQTHAIINPSLLA